MDFHFLDMEKSWKINIEKEGAPCIWLFVYLQCMSKTLDVELSNVAA